jgi:hypothetical protein
MNCTHLVYSHCSWKRSTVIELCAVVIVELKTGFNINVSSKSRRGVDSPTLIQNTYIIFFQQIRYFVRCPVLCADWVMCYIVQKSKN